MFPELVARCAHLTPAQIDALESHYRLLIRWNRTLNLTRIEKLEEAVERHYCESLFLASNLPAGGLRIVDIGSGAGFPGFPVAVARPECSVTLVESHQRKAVFLKEASRSVPNIRVSVKRAEDLDDSFDWAISRAVSYEDLAPSLSKLAANAALLTGPETPGESLCFTWNSPITLPWGRQR